MLKKINYKIMNSFFPSKERKKIMTDIAKEGLAYSIDECCEVSMELCQIIEQVLHKDPIVLEQLKKAIPHSTDFAAKVNINTRHSALKKTALLYALNKLENQESVKEYTQSSPLLTLINTLLNYNADVTLADGSGMTPLHVVARKATYYLKLMDQLLEKGALVNAQDEEGYTSLYFATQSNHIAAIDLLIQHGADLDKVDEHHRTPLIGQAVASYCNNGTRRETIEHLLKNYSCKLNEQDKRGNTLMHYLASSVSFCNLYHPTNEEIFSTYLTIKDGYDCLSLALSLFERGATCHQPNKEGDTPLHCALTNAYKAFPIIQLFFKKGALINQTNLKNQTPLLAGLKALHDFETCDCAAFSYKNMEEKMKTLLQFSPDVTLEDKDGDTCIKLIAQLKTLSDQLKGQIVYLANPALAILLFAKAKKPHQDETTNYHHLPAELKEIIINFLIADVYSTCGRQEIQWLKAYHLHLAKNFKMKKTVEAKEALCLDSKFRVRS